MRADREGTIAALKGRIASIEAHGAPAPSPDARTGGDPTAFDRIVRLCSVRDRASRELAERLRGEGFEEAEVASAVDRAVACGLVDDARFADSLIRGRIAKGKGAAGIERELESRGIDAATLPGWPDEYFEGVPSERDRAVEVLRKSPPRSKNAREGAYRKLVGKGFSPDVASSVAREWADYGADL